MKYSIAVILVIVAVASAEPPLRNGGGFVERQQVQQPPYSTRGIRPAGPGFNLPLRSQKQQLPPTPAASYGPPPQEYGPPAAEATTTETPFTTTETIEVTTTVNPQSENIRVPPKSEKLLSNAPQENQRVNPATIYVLLPQSQNLVYAAAPSSTSAKLVAAQVQQQPVQAVPASAKLQEVPQFAQLQNFQVVGPVEAIPVPSSAYSSVVNTPYSYTFVQSFQ